MCDVVAEIVGPLRADLFGSLAPAGVERQLATAHSKIRDVVASLPADKRQKLEQCIAQLVRKVTIDFDLVRPAFSDYDDGQLTRFLFASFLDVYADEYFMTITAIPELKNTMWTFAEREVGVSTEFAFTVWKGLRAQGIRLS